MSNKRVAIGLAASIVSIIISIALIFGFWLPRIQESQLAIQEAERELEEIQKQIEDPLQERIEENAESEEIEELLEETTSKPDFNIFGVDYSYSTPTFFELERLAFSIQNMGEATATNVTISVVWLVRDIDVGWTNIDFGITNDVADALDYYNVYLTAFGEESVYTKHALDKLEQARNDDRELKPNEITTYTLTIPEDVNNKESIYYRIVEIGDIIFSVSCAEGIEETFVFT